MGTENEDELQALQRAWRITAASWGLPGLETNMLLPRGDAMAPQPPDDTERRMRLLVQVGYLLPFDDDRELREWLRRSSADLGGDTPLEVLAGPLPELSRVRALLETRRLP